MKQKTIFSVLFSIFILLSLGEYHCSLKKPMAPKWDVELSLPLSNRITYMDEIVSRTKELYIDSIKTNIVGFRIGMEAEPVEMGDNLRLDDFSLSFSSHLGSVTIHPATDSTKVTLIEIWPGSRDYQDTTLDSIRFDPPIEINITKKLLFESFSSLVIESGELEVTVTNRQPIIFKELTLTLSNQAGGEIAQIAFPDTLESGETQTEVASLAGKTVSNLLQIIISSQSPGSGGRPAPVDTLSALATVVALRNLKVSEAVARIPAQHFETTNQFNFSHTDLERATFYSGVLRVSGQNDLPLEIDSLLLKFSEMEDSAGDTFALRFLDIRSQMPFDVSLSLAGVTFQPPVAQNFVNCKVSAWTENTGETQVTITSGDSITVQLSIRDMVFSNIKGILDSIRIPFRPLEKTIKLPEGLKGGTLLDPTLRLDISFSNPNIPPIIFDLLFQGTDLEGKVDSLRVAEVFKGQPLIFNKNTLPGLPDFLHPLPQKIELNTSASRIYLGDGLSQGEADRSDIINSEFTFSAPFDAILYENRVKPPIEKTSIEADTKVPLKEARIDYEVVNHLPLAVDTIVIYVSEDSTRLYSPEAEVIIGPIKVFRPPLNPEGKVTGEARSDGTIYLGESQLNLFKNPTPKEKTLYTGLLIKVPGSGQPIKIYAEDYLKIKATAKIKMRVDKDEF